MKYARLLNLAPLSSYCIFECSVAGGAVAVTLVRTRIGCTLLMTFMINMTNDRPRVDGGRIGPDMMRLWGICNLVGWLRVGSLCRSIQRIDVLWI